MDLPEYLISDFLTGRYQRLASPLYGVYMRELARFTDNVDPFLKMFPVQDQFIATLFFEQQLNPMLKSYTEAKKILTSYAANETVIKTARNTLEKLCANACTNNLTMQIKNIETLENNQKNLQDSFYYKCATLYPINAYINTNNTTVNANLINNNIQHLN